MRHILRSAVIGALLLAGVYPAFAQTVTVEYSDMSHSYGNTSPSIYGLTLDGSGGMVATSSAHVIFRIGSGSATLLAGSYGGYGYVDGPAANARFAFPRGVAVDHAGNLFVCDLNNNVIRKITPAGMVSTFAGLGQTAGFADGTGSTARFNGPNGMTIDDADNLYIADASNGAIRKITPAGVVSTVAGNGTRFTFADGTGAAARFYQPWNMAMGGDGNVYVSDNCTILRVTPAGVVTTVVGSPGSCGSTDGVGTAARVGGGSLAAGPGGVLYFGDGTNYTLRQISSNMTVTTIAGKAGFGDLIPGTGNYARLGNFAGMVWDGSTLQIADWYYNGGPVSEVLWHTTPTIADTVTVDTNPAPVPQPRQLDTNPQTATSWHWYLLSKPSGSSSTFDSTMRNPVFTPDIGGTFRIACRAANATGVSITWLDFFATCPNLSTPTITRTSGPSLSCPGAPITLTVSAGYPSYLWSTGATTQSITVSPTQSTGYTVQGIDANGCRSPAGSYSQTVYFQPTQSALSSVNTGGYICDGTTGAAVTATGWNNATWSPYVTWGYRTVSGGAITAIPGATGPSYALNTANFPGPGVYYLVAINTPPCNFGTVVSQQYTVNIEQPPTIVASASATTSCANTNITLTASVSNLPNRQFLTYYINWFRASTNYSVAECRNNPTCTTQVLPGDGFYAQLFDGVCYVRSQTFTLTALPTPTPTFTYAATCNGVTATVTNPNPNSTYRWSNGAVGTSMIPATSAYYYLIETSSNGCDGYSGSQFINQTFPATPTVTASSPTTFCQNGSVTLTASTGFSSYSWSNGATTRSIVVGTSGNYVVTTTDAAGCVKSAAPVAVTVNPLPQASITAGGPTTFCAGGSVTLTASAAASYAWSNGATTQSITVSSAGNYSVSVTDANGCSATSAPTAVTVNALPAPSIVVSQQYNALAMATDGPALIAAPQSSGDTYSFCGTNLNIRLTALGGSSYLWSTGATTGAITVTQSGTYTVTATNAAGCSADASVTIIITPYPAPQITASGPTAICPNGGSVTLTSDPADSYLWSTGATTRSIVATQPGVYSVQVTINSCTGSSQSVNVTHTAASVSASPQTLCAGGSVTLTASGGASWLWSTGATTQSIDVNQPGDYSVTVTDAGGCAVTASASIAAPVSASVSTTTPHVCGNGQVSVSAAVQGGAGPYTYQWYQDGNPIAGATSAAYGVTLSGWTGGSTTFSVGVTDAGGCHVTTEPQVIDIDSTPVVYFGNPAASYCTGQTYTIAAAPPGYAQSYQWSLSGGTIVSTNGQFMTFTAGAAGEAVITVTGSNANGCTATASTTVPITANNVPTPVVDASGPTSFCEGGSVYLTAPSGSNYSYRWSTGATTQLIRVDVSGSYSVTVTDGASTCGSTSAPVVVTVHPPAATPIITGTTVFCAGSSTTLTASVGSSYALSNGATTQSITVTSAGSYSVTVTDANGCSAQSAPTVVTVNAVTTPTISGATSFCAGGSTTLTASAGSSYAWTNGATTQSITVSSAGSFSVTVTDANGCSAQSAPAVVTVNTPATPTISGATSFCTGGSTTLTASAGASYSWSNGATTQSITVSSAGSYSVTVTDANGCSAQSAPAVVTINSPTTPTISGATSFCTGGSTTLTASAGASYSWSNGATTQSITVNAGGNYTVTVTDANGCSAQSAPAVVTVNTPVTPTITGATSFCAGGSTTLTASAGASYSWSSGATTQSITVNAAGTFRVTVTDANGCSAQSAPAVVTLNTPVTPTISGATSFCAGGSTTLTASAGASYSWTNGATTQSITVNAAGTFRVTVTDANGCSAQSAPVTVTVKALPTAAVSGGATICAGGSATVNATLTGTAPFNLTWSDGFTQSVSTTSVARTVTPASTRTYTITSISDANCSGTGTGGATVTVNTLPAFTQPPNQSIPRNTSATLTVTPSGTAPFTYQWYKGNAPSTSNQVATTQTYVTPHLSKGTYTYWVKVTNSCGSTSSTTITITVP